MTNPNYRKIEGIIGEQPKPTCPQTGNGDLGMPDMYPPLSTKINFLGKPLEIKSEQTRNGYNPQTSEKVIGYLVKANSREAKIIEQALKTASPPIPLCEDVKDESIFEIMRNIIRPKQ